VLYITRKRLVLITSKPFNALICVAFDSHLNLSVRWRLFRTRRCWLSERLGQVGRVSLEFRTYLHDPPTLTTAVCSVYKDEGFYPLSSDKTCCPGCVSEFALFRGHYALSCHVGLPILCWTLPLFSMCVSRIGP